jgi:hypothetical protein
MAENLVTSALRLLPLVGLVCCVSSQPAAAQSEMVGSRTLLVNVTQGPLRVGLRPGEHLLTFGQPVEIPGARLLAGTYLFRLMAPSILQVVSGDGSKVIRTFMTIPAEGEGDTRRERIKLQELSDGSLRIVGWYLPDAIGHEFLYPKPKRESIERPR